MKKPIDLFTIGFTKKSAQTFFDTLLEAGVKRVIDTRLNNCSQLAGFTKRADLEYFLNKIGNIDYIHRLDLAPTKDILDEYKKKAGDWATYEQRFLQLMKERQIEQKVSPEILDGACLLCSEPTPHHCHRRLVAEYLNERWGNLKICHL
ncbi:MAG TPA: hypothetical protein DDZ80_22410 [Cyanobacteria bacterium UBA8803]|nr:hypothetical protein [Cyanobacteria bacterium UBA9273]HBL61081.1 hypothetical protein [Cyanobacteria bacterium UBA8803]